MRAHLVSRAGRCRDRPRSTRPVTAARPRPSPKDVAQGQVGDCWFLATLAETALRDPSRISDSIHQRVDGTYDVYFHTSATTIWDIAMGKKYASRMSGRPGIRRLRSIARPSARIHSGIETPNIYFADTQNA